MKAWPELLLLPLDFLSSIFKQPLALVSDTCLVCFASEIRSLLFSITRDSTIEQAPHCSFCGFLPLVISSLGSVSNSCQLQHINNGAPVAIRCQCLLFPWPLTTLLERTRLKASIPESMLLCQLSSGRGSRKCSWANLFCVVYLRLQHERTWP